MSDWHFKCVGHRIEQHEKRTLAVTDCGRKPMSDEMKVRFAQGGETL